MEISNKVIIITGGVGGMGFETAKALLNHGAKFVALFDLTETDGQSAIEKLDKEFGKGRAGFYPGDIVIDSEFEDNFNRIIKDHGSIDVLINNAGIANEQNIERLVNVNVKAVLNSSLLALNHMGKHKGGKGGAIVNVNAILGLIDCPILPFYSATKHAIIGFTRCMKENFATTGVRVMSVCPGVTKTNLIKEIPNHILDFVTDNLKDKALNEVPVQSPKSVGSAITEIIQKGECGAVWVVENDKKPLVIKPCDHYIRMGTPVDK
ncbi:15-hydroxyprostaglandin dehydrogenase [NAD(+)] [Nasonia vitripennis]|uniref:Alcohol dehydrogenase n=1 Tax=Nasonia vitripennis TaxID=7425 RepID=A0A7M7GBW1_NASVI|nr:15-hydroxyprostaglandin dehydrogenase [NAD(+)] [Nasonia vitripennis]